MNKNQQVKQLRLSGMTYKEIGNKLNISIGRVHQIYKNYKPINAKIRTQILERDNYCCCKCYSFFILEIHHIDGNSHNNNYENLQTLCKACHAKTDSVDRKQTRNAERKWINDNWHLRH